MTMDLPDSLACPCPCPDAQVSSLHVRVSVIAPHALTVPQARTGTITNANVGAVPSNPTVANPAQAATSDRPAHEQQPEAERESSTSRPDTSLVPLPCPSVLRDAAEQMRQAAVQVQGPASQRLPRHEPMQVCEDAQPEISSLSSVFRNTPSTRRPCFETRSGATKR